MSIVYRHGNEGGDTPTPTLVGAVASTGSPVNTGTSAWSLTGGAEAYVEFSPTTALGTTYYIRSYFYISGAPSALTRILGFISIAGFFISVARLNTSRQVVLYDLDGIPIGTSSALPTGSMQRVEVGCLVPSTGNVVDGRVGLRVGGTEIVPITQQGNVGLSAINRVRSLKEAVTISGGVFVIDDFGMNSSAGASDNSWVGATGAGSGPQNLTLTATPSASTSLGLTTPGGSSSAYRQPKIPVGIPLANTADCKVQDAGNRCMFRFVVPEVTPLRAMIIWMTFKSLSWYAPGGCYARGDGGVLRMELRAVDAVSGLPIMSGSPIGAEQIGAQAGVNRSRARYGGSGPSVDFIHFFMNAGQTTVDLIPGVMYAAIISNAHSDPGNNFFSVQNVACHASLDIAQKGNYPNEDPATAPQSTHGLDHRCVLGWTRNKDNLGTYPWRFGQGVGGPGGPGPSGESGCGYYDGFTTGGDDGIRIPCYGWEVASGSRKYGQPYSEYMVMGAYTLNCGVAKRTDSITHVGAYVPAGRSAGTITVRNVTTGQSRAVAVSGSGLVRAALPTPLLINLGDSFQLVNTDTVFLAKADGPMDAVFGTPDGITTSGNGNDRAQMRCEPWPHHVITAAPPGPVAPDRALNRPATASSVQPEQPSLTADKANDGDSGTRWSSFQADNEWWKVDLQAEYLVREVRINWEDAYSCALQDNALPG